VEPDLDRLVLGAGLTFWADDTDLELGYRGQYGGRRRAVRQHHRGRVDELREDDHAARLCGVAQRGGPDLGKRRCRQNERATSRASRALFILNFMGVPFSLRPLAGDVSAQALCQLIY